MPATLPGPRPDSAARLWAPLARFSALDARLGDAAQARGPVAAGLYEFLRFGVKQGWACLFGGALCGLMIVTYLAYPAGVPLARYDVLTLAAVAIQVAMLALRLETWEEARVILVFHLVGTAMELYKTRMGSWLYPEPSWLRLGGVPLFSGFLYASVGSYLARVWRLFDFRFTRHPPLWTLVVLSLAIYLNFFTQHVVTDLRLGLFAAAIALFGPATVHFRVWRVHRRMPLLLGLVLVTLFIWIAENIGTATRGWIYPHQAAGWAAVSPQKFGSWFLLMIISYTLVALVSRPKVFGKPSATAGAAPSAAIDARPARPTSPPAPAGSLPE
ncbi:Uncharacterized membrane protein YoaT, DUF817 family [Methylobacterium sp. 174MFSha1.1]|uniref:DUF817 domain-containing protein n=1 Tax=Methylobacterium sp. 174MFSha1.1 TaxID=1502749 RepID=UPI0008ED10C2|nr:DUF817 domain-containing protein [Methylobacterium sp. 174MFSha1.1]SFU30371.1 Uncharacterized membrane protein YoaT, DUF817 family [Methylobacterium sp. 174MFSha1.1]